MTDRKKTLAIGQVVDKKDRKNYIGHLYNSDRQKNPVWPLFKLQIKKNCPLVIQIENAGHWLTCRYKTEKKTLLSQLVIYRDR